jgi:BlaI family transcriptional regulator, penicillinase repressor
MVSPMRRLGELERRVMEVLWESPESPMSGRDVFEALPDRAYTTVLTILERLRQKSFVRRTTQGRVHYFSAADSREAYVAELMIDAMGDTHNRSAVLARFAESVTPSEARILRDALQKTPHPERRP